jgi:sigma-B regulation protein RsbU (phosphoserine phosphatase)
MQRGPRDYWRGLGRVERIFVLLTLLYTLLYFTGISPGLASLVALAAFFFGLLTLVRLARKAIWRLRNRLVVAYLFIAVVPIALILLLVVIAAYVIVGQMAVYLVDNELSRRVSFLAGPAENLIRSPAPNRELLVARFAPLIESRFPKFELLIRGKTDIRYPADAHIEPPSSQWPQANGLIVKDNQLYAWAHARTDENEFTLLAPVTHDLLSQLIPGLGDVDLGGPYARQPRQRTVPPKQNPFDMEVPFVYPMQIQSWDAPKTTLNGYLFVDTRFSAVLGTVFGQKLQWSESATTLFAAVGILFLLVEMASLIAGVRLSRTMTGAVHELYQGTQHVKEGDFSYRIPVRGDDQLAELSSSFNTMTDNLRRLIVVAKENERLQSELEIAREVQAQLFPKAAPSIRGLKLAGVCNPARMVSGDYYDFLSVSEGAVAFAIGDVAGKGISAALLMAAIQSSMRTQLTGAIGARPEHFSAASLVSTLNQQLYASTSAEKYATFFFALYDDTQHSLTYTNAGHLPPFLMRSEELLPLDPTGTVVGAFPMVEYGEQTIPLEPGDILVAYTDGIVEPEDVYGEMFGEDRFKELLLRYRAAESAEIIARAMEAVVTWTGSSELQDDMTMLVARRV